MTIGLLGRKLGMTQIFDEAGRAVPVTVVEVGPCPITALRTEEKHGYMAVQLGFGAIKPHKVTKPVKGQFEKAGLEPCRWLREFRLESLEGFEVGKVLDASLFEAGEKIDVTGTSKGKGFAGFIKRHNGNRGPSSHGASKFHRRPGSSGGSSYPGKVFKGQVMPGQMGDEKVTVKNLDVVAVDSENNLLLVKGAVPGARNGLVVVRKKK
ncbi:MAG: 50S ribosomal protein L3 [Synergistaceae bacterium]|jgi:large subunit ribosomal protein L3|nr:50S ribosomal protein L3 [Synergistaceae bacterium]